jgi:hypothetical protein
LAALVSKKSLNAFLGDGLAPGSSQEDGGTDGVTPTVPVCRVAVVTRQPPGNLAAIQSVGHQQFGGKLILPADKRKLVIITRYGCDLDAMLPQRRDQLVDCVPQWLGGAISGLPIPNGVDVNARGLGELLLRQAGEYSRRPKVATIVETIDVSSDHVLHRRSLPMVIAPPFS